MTTDEKSRISELRKQGCTYAKIAEMLSIPESTIKTVCRRTRLAGDADEVKPKCKQCGQPITVKAKCKPRRFCSDKCRTAWWFANHSANREEGITVIMISHDIAAATRYASHILHLSHKPLFCGTTADYLKSRIGKAYGLEGGNANA